MPNSIRPQIPGATIFFTVALARQGDDLLCRNIDQLRQSVRATMAEMPFEIRAWVVLPDHLHAIWSLPANDHDFSTRWRAIKTRFTKSVGAVRPRSQSKVAKGEAGLWQRRYWDHHIRGKADLDTHLRYCWGNPVKHGLVDRATDWPYSSIHRDIAHGLVEPSWSHQLPPGQFGE